MGGPHRAAARSEGDPMSRRHPRRARFGVEALEGRKLTAAFDAFLEIDGIKGETEELDSRPTQQVLVSMGDASVRLGETVRPAEFIIL
jgi:hypothetical protein